MVETLHQAIRKDTLITGIQVPGSAGKEAKCSQYATLLLTDNFSVTRTFHIINIFEEGSGSKLHPEKTEGIWFGSKPGQSTGPSADKMSWKADKIKVLGLYFGNRDLDKDNWSARVAKLEKRLNFWKSRTLSFKGKSLIINTIGASGLWYTATVLTMPGWVHTKVNKLIWDFLWSGKTELVKRKRCILPCAQGRLHVINPAEKGKALKLRWIPCLCDLHYSAKCLYFGWY